MFLEILQNSQENTCVRVYFLINLQDFKKRFSGTGIFLWILRNFLDYFFYRTTSDNCFWWYQFSTGTFYLIVSTLFWIQHLHFFPILQIHQVPFCKSGQQSTFFIFTATSSSLTTSVISFYNTKQERSSTHAIEKFLIGASRHFRAHKLTDTSCEHMTLTKTSAQKAWLGLSLKPCSSTSLWVQQSK